MSRNGRLSCRIRLASRVCLNSPTSLCCRCPLPVAPLFPRVSGQVPFPAFDFPVSCPPPAVSRPLVDDLVSRVLSPKRV